MSYLIDTNVLSELRKTAKCDPNVLAWKSGVRADQLLLSVISLGEIRRGVELLRQRSPAGAARLEAWLDGLIAHYQARILPITLPIADRWGRLGLREPLPIADGLLAATALEHRLTVVTRNSVDFARTGVPILNPFLAASA